MNILSKLLTALRGVATETGEAIVDAQGVRILEQEVRDAKAHLDQAKENLTEVIAEQMAAQRKVEGLKTSVAEHEQYVLQALEQNNEALALEIAEKIASLSNELEAQSAVQDSLGSSVSILKQSITETERNIQGLERELTLVKTTESVNKANEAIATRFSGSHAALRSATESLERIKAKQQKKTDRLQAALDLQEEENGENLHAKLQEAGIISKKATADSILERLRAERVQA